MIIITSWHAAEVAPTPLELRARSFLRSPPLKSNQNHQNRDLELGNGWNLRHKMMKINQNSSKIDLKNLKKYHLVMELWWKILKNYKNMFFSIVRPFFEAMLAQYSHPRSLKILKNQQKLIQNRPKIDQNLNFDRFSSNFCWFFRILRLIGWEYWAT